MNSLILVTHTTYQIKKGRANQMNYGAKIAKGDILWFIHCDSVLQKDVIEKVLTCPTEVGCLKIRSTQIVFLCGLIH